MQMLGEEDKTPPEDMYDAECSVHHSSALMVESCFGVPWRAPRYTCVRTSSRPSIVSPKVSTEVSTTTEALATIC